MLCTELLNDFAEVGVKNLQYVYSSKYLATTDWTWHFPNNNLIFAPVSASTCARRVSFARWPGSIAHRVMNHETRLSTEDKTFTVSPWTPWQYNTRPQLGNYVIDTPTLHNIGGSVNLCATDRCIPPRMNDSTSLSRQQLCISVIQAKKKEKKKRNRRSLFE